MKTKLLTFIIVVLMLSCDKVEFQAPVLERYTFNMSFRIPDGTSKVPNCKNILPSSVEFTIRNDDNEVYTYESPLINNNGNWISDSEFTLPYGIYDIIGVELISDTDEVVYALPTLEDTEILHYADIILPISVELSENTMINGTAFCYDKLPIPENTISLDLGLEVEEVESLYMYVYSRECVSMLTVEIDAYRIPEITVFEVGFYEAGIPKVYTDLFIRVYDLDGFLIESHYVAPGQNNRVIKINPECD